MPDWARIARIDNLERPGKMHCDIGRQLIATEERRDTPFSRVHR